MPAAAVIRRVQALLGITGRKERVGGLWKVRCESLWLNHRTAFETDPDLEYWKGQMELVV